LGQLTEFARRGEGRWSVSSIADRTEYAAPGLFNGFAGAKGEVLLSDGTRLHAKAMVDLKNDDVVHVNLPGGGGYGDPIERAPERVLWDVIEGYLTPDEAQKSYGVVVRYTGKSDALVKMPADWVLDEVGTKQLREKMKAENGKLAVRY
jgi:N-methylhydantoinase B